MLATPPREKKSLAALRDVSNVAGPQSPAGARSPSSPWKGELPSQIKRKQLKNLNKRLRFQPYPSPEPSSSAYATSSPAQYSKHTHANPLAASIEHASLRVQDKQVILLGRKTPSAAVLAKHGASDSFVLPVQSKNVSRVHAVLSSTRLEILGQNGVTVNGETMAAGQSRDVSAESFLVLDFYGDFIIDVKLPRHVEELVRPVAPLPSPLAVSSSPNLAARQLDFRLDEEDEDLSLDEPVDQQQPEEAEPDLCSEPPAFELSAEVGEEDLSDLSDSEEEVPQSPIIEEPLSEELVGLLAQTLVFHGKTTVPTSDILSALCDERHSANQVMDALRRGPFGVVEDAKLKDASGRQLQASWFYEPEQDHDAGRREALAPFMKRVRKSQMSAKRYVWAKPTLKPRRYY